MGGEPACLQTPLAPPWLPFPCKSSHALKTPPPRRPVPDGSRQGGPSAQPNPVNRTTGPQHLAAQPRGPRYLGVAAGRIYPAHRPRVACEQPRARRHPSHPQVPPRGVTGDQLRARRHRAIQPDTPTNRPATPEAIRRPVGIRGGKGKLTKGFSGGPPPFTPFLARRSPFAAFPRQGPLAAFTYSGHPGGNHFGNQAYETSHPQKPGIYTQTPGPKTREGDKRPHGFFGAHPFPRNAGDPPLAASSAGAF